MASTTSRTAASVLVRSSQCISGTAAISGRQCYSRLRASRSRFAARPISTRSQHRAENPTTKTSDPNIFSQQDANRSSSSSSPIPPSTTAKSSDKPSSPASFSYSNQGRPNHAARPHEPPPATARNTAAGTPPSKNGSVPVMIQDLANHGFGDGFPETGADASPAGSPQLNWSSSFAGLSSAAFPKEVTDILLAPIDKNDAEVKPDGIVYLPEIKYRRILNRAFGPGGWGLAPRGETIVTPKLVTREYALIAQGRLISIARGEQPYFDADGIPTATEGCKSNALMRCCKDLGIASELWDPRWLRQFTKDHTRELWVEHAVNKKRRKITIRKDDEVMYPFKETK